MDQPLEHDCLSLPSDVSRSSLQSTGLFSVVEHRLHFDRLATTEEMMAIGLTLHDLNFYDGSSEILIAGMQHARQLQAAIDKVSCPCLTAQHRTGRHRLI